MTFRRTVLRSIFVTSLGGILGLVTLTRDVYVAKLYGFSPEIKNYVASVLLPMILINSAGGALASSYTPFFYQRALSHPGTGSQWPVRKLVAITAAIVGIVYLVIVGARLVTGDLLLAPSYYFLGHQHTDEIALGFLVLFALYARVINSILLARENYVASMLSQCAVPAGSVVFLVFLATPTTYSELVYALAFGYLLQALFCYALSIQARRSALRLTSNAHAVHDAAPNRDFVLRLVAMFFGALVLASLEYIEITFAAMRSAESVAPVTYASRMVALFLGLIMAGTGNIITLKFIDLAGTGSGSSYPLRRNLVRALLSSFFIGSLICIVAWLAAGPFVQLIYSGGKLTPSELKVLEIFVIKYSWTIPPALVAFIAGRALIARGRQSVLLLGALCTVSTSLIANLVFFWLSLPVDSVILATVIGYCSSAVFLIYASLAN